MSAKAAAKPPETLFELVTTILRASVRGLAVGLVFRLLVGFTLAFFAWLLHTYLLVVVNEGFNEDKGWLTDILALTGWRWVTGTVVWGLATYLVTTLAFRALGRGPIRLVKDLFTTHTWVFRSFQHGHLAGIPFAVAGVGIGLFVGTFLGSRTGAAEMALALGLSIAMQGSGLLLVASLLGWNDLQRLLGLKQRSRFPVQWLVVAQVGVLGGLLRSVVIPNQPTAGYLGSFGIAGFAVLFGVAALVARRSPAAAVGLVAAAFLGEAWPAWADDGGWQEAGGTFGSWLTSEGAFTAAAVGVGPGLGTLAGFLAGSATTLIPYDLFPPLDLDDGEDWWTKWFGTGETPPEAPTPPPTEPPAAPPAEPAMEDIPQEIKDIKDLISGFLGTEQGAAITQGLIGRIKGLGESADDVIKGYGAWVKANAEILEGGQVRFADDAARAAQLDDLLKAMRTKEIMKWISDGATVVGVAFDAYDNMMKGDPWYYALGKASGAGAIMAHLGEKNPALGLMEFANFLAFGGSKASDCISPAKNISGGFNVLIDTLTDATNGTNNAQIRIQRGDYGENIKNLGDAAAIAGEYWEDPDTVGKDLADFVTDDSTWDDMYSQSHEVWKPPPDAWLPKQLACGAGELLTDGVIKSGEIAAKAGGWAGEAYENVKQGILSWF